MNDMQAIDIARRLAELGQTQDACNAYLLAMQKNDDPALKLEAALYTLQFGEDYKVPYTWLRELYDLPEYRDQVLPILTEAFYTPNEKQMKTRYEKNCRQLQKYPYLFRKDFPKFEELTIRFFPYDDNGFLPYHRENRTFDPYFNPRNQQITHYFFQDLEKPILAHDIYSQYELEYLRDNVRASEDVAKENHIYLHYTDWEVFCAYLQILNVYPLLERKKIVFLMEEEESRYPLDFQKEYGIDYSKFPLKPPAFEEYTRLIWHTQLSSDNGGDFFNEIMDGHPNLIMVDSIFMQDVKEWMDTFQDDFNQTHQITLLGNEAETSSRIKWILSAFTPEEVQTPKGRLLCLLLGLTNLKNFDAASRICPVIFFQPHFYNILCAITKNTKGQAVQQSNALDAIHDFPAFGFFPYMKTFTPMRRFTTSGAALVRFQSRQEIKITEESGLKIPMHDDAVSNRIVNRTFMIDWQDRLFKDSVLVRFEDGKLNPRATFTALARFLDIPYTDSMTYCSLYGQQDPESVSGNARGFDPRTVYSTYDEFLGDPERYLIEYYLQDAYRFYGYDFHYYDGKKLKYAQILEKEKEITIMDQYIKNSAEEGYGLLKEYMQTHELTENSQEKLKAISIENEEEFVNYFYNLKKENRENTLRVLFDDFTFYNKNGQPLHFMPLLKLDPELLEQPLYH